MEGKARMVLRPLTHFFAMMRRDIVADHVDRRHRWGNLCLKRCEEGDKLALAFPAMTLLIDTPGPGIKSRKQILAPHRGDTHVRPGWGAKAGQVSSDGAAAATRFFHRS